jgi:hypothetical protein
MNDEEIDCPLCEDGFDALDGVRDHLTDDHTQEAVVYRLVGELELG